MPGKRLDSEQQWTSLSLREQGGFAAVQLGCTVRRTELDAQVRDPTDALVTRLRALPDMPQAPMPDAQQLVVDVTAGDQRTTQVFDRSDLPADVDALLQLVRGVQPFRPV
ncbi:protealysin inhibitor emfourin [Pseudaquabacterium pictum]|uniref:Uncharacterized protein n=1 Tax=Pseudaquabacterium pictum TaxID=2315236 RepID=A0A480AK72_9BURK|nr:protealysin inhibitor emfourin [Rubrivivax pictus]GCL61941.1 hypothetical protein AQPW35_10220 [Rubrivivax pictus]